MNRPSPAVTQVLGVCSAPFEQGPQYKPFVYILPLSEAVKHRRLKYVSLAYLN